MPYSRDYKRKYEFFRRKLKKQVSYIYIEFLGMIVLYTESVGHALLKVKIENLFSILTTLNSFLCGKLAFS